MKTVTETIRLLVTVRITHDTKSARRQAIAAAKRCALQGSILSAGSDGCFSTDPRKAELVGATTREAIKTQNGHLMVYPPGVKVVYDPKENRRWHQQPEKKTRLVRVVVHEV